MYTGQCKCFNGACQSHYLLHRHRYTILCLKGSRTGKTRALHYLLQLRVLLYYSRDANANTVFFQLPLYRFPPEHSTANTRTLSCTLPWIPSTAGTITTGDWGQAVFSTPQIPDRVSCSTNTTSPLFLCLLIPPRIRRHSWVMTEMISPTPPHHPPPNTSYITSYRSILVWTRPFDGLPPLLLLRPHLYLYQILFFFFFFFTPFVAFHTTGAL